MSDHIIVSPFVQQGKKRPHNWQGGRVVASNGYVLIHVGKEHHLADVRGYAYEHRLVAEQKIGRTLREGEVVHHIDENKQNNDPSNLEVVAGIAEHRFHHRRLNRGLQLPKESNPTIQCACGCGRSFSKYDDSGRPRKFISGHNNETGLRALVVCYLENVPFPGTPRFIAEMFDGNERSVLNVLCKLKKEGLVTRDTGRNGEWRLRNG